MSQAAPDAAPRPERWQELVSKQEMQSLLRVSDLRGAGTLLLDWGIVAATFAVVARWPNPLTVVLALFVLAGRQLGCAVVMHEAAHRTLFSNRALNDWAGNWLAAYPIWSEVGPYRRYHLLHHAYTGTERDPDLSLALPFPTTRGSLLRKVWRDLSGQTGWKQAKLTLQRDLGRGNRRTQRNQGLKAGERPDVGWHKLAPVALTNGVLLGALAVAGHAELYLLWVVAWLTTYRLVMRIRAIAEHAMTDQGSDPFRNTRTTLVRWWERLVFAPNYVNYHLEHHLAMTVPHYNLRRMHRLLRGRGAYARARIAEGGYWQVLREAASKPAAA